MIFIAHRVNNLNTLKLTPKHYGIEVDIRSKGEKLIIHHDPFSEGESFESWINFFEHSFLILNIKEEGLEDKIIHLMNKKNINNYFFLDQSFPFILKYSKKSSRRSAIRVSEFESIETAIKASAYASWVWVDCFSHFPLTKSEYTKLKKEGYKLCLVSPELQGRNSDKEIEEIFNFLKKNNMFFDAICSKKPNFWEDLYDSKQ